MSLIKAKGGEIDMLKIETKFLDCIFEDGACRGKCSRPGSERELLTAQERERVSWLDGLVEGALRGEEGLGAQVQGLARCSVLEYSQIVQSLRSGKAIDLGLIRALKAVVLPRYRQVEESVYEVTGMDRYLSSLSEDGTLNLLTATQSLVKGWEKIYFRECCGVDKDVLWSNARNLITRGLIIGGLNNEWVAGVKRYSQGKVDSLEDKEKQALLSNGGLLVYNPDQNLISDLV